MKKILLFVFLCIGLLVNSQSTDPDLLLEYRFENNFEDSSGNGYHPTNFGVTFVPDRFGNENGAAYFNGIDNYLSLPNLSELKPDLPVTIQFWIKYDNLSTNNSDVFNTSFEEDKSSGVFFTLSSANSKFGVGHGDGSNNYTSSTRRSFLSDKQAEANVWTHITLVLNSSVDMKIYVDCKDHGGIHSGSGGDLYYSSTPGNIGRHDRNVSQLANYFKGSIDDFRYWKRALTAEEISNNGNCGATLSTLNNSITIQEPIIYPNPTSGELNIKSGTREIKSIIVYNMLGKQILRTDFKKSIDLSNYQKGIYLIKLIHENGSTLKKVVVN